MMTTWEPTVEEVRRIVAELRPVIDEFERRSRRELAACGLRRSA